MKLRNLEIQHSTQRDPQIWTQLKCVQQEINQIYDEENEKKMRFTKQKYYETGQRAMKLLSWRLRKQQAERTVYKVRNPKNNQICQKLEEIQQAFEAYYKDLYTQPDKADDFVINEFLNSLDLPSI